MKKKTWDNGNKMHFESGHKAFDHQTDCISTGNVWANTQYSGYIRSHLELECNGFFNDPGHLRNYDIKQFNFALFGGVRQWLQDYKEKKVILYVWKHYNGQKRIIDGITITDEDHNKLATFFPYGHSYKASLAVNEAEKYVCN